MKPPIEFRPDVKGVAAEKPLTAVEELARRKAGDAKRAREYRARKREERGG